MEKKRGLSLVESIVATAILAIILVSVFAIFQQGYVYMRKTRMATTAYFLAQSKLEESYNQTYVFSGGGLRANNTTQEAFPGNYSGYSWTRTFAMQSGYTDLAVINVTVYWP
jgi:prepilin-type N-terminal cleavage/methylation domain-containing protein